MKNSCIVFALCAMFFFAACSGGSKETVYDDTDSGSQSGEKNDSDNGDSQGDTTPDNGDSQHEGTDSSDSVDDSVDDSGDTVPDNSEPSEPTEDADSSEPTDDADSSDPVSDDDADTAEEENACKNNPCQAAANSTGRCIPKGTEDYSCECKENYTWENNLCNADSRVSNCTGLPANASWNTVSSITQTWNGTEWVPSTDATFSTTESTTKCRFICNQNYSWNDSECVAETRNANCEGLPENAVWNSAASITQTWDDENWVPSSTGTYNQNSSTTECRFKCAPNYNWTGSQCVAATNQVECTGLPENALWNTASYITQNWNGTEWIPTNTGSFNETPSSSECRFVCKTNYTWNGVACAPNEMNAVACTGKPANAIWNTVSSITQTWNGTAWFPTTSATFSETPSTTQCFFKCAEHYDWNASNKSCDATTQPAYCSAKPVNTVWNDNGANGTFTQTWTDSGWYPASYTSEYSVAAGTCRYKCDSVHTLENGNCINQKTAECSAKPANTVWNDNGANGTYTQSWSSSNGWYPASYASEYSASAGTCKYKCDSAHTWENGLCINQKTAQCSAKPANTVWNDGGANGTFTQNWTDSGWAPANYASEYSASAGTCKYKCDSAHTWENGSCINQRTAQCSEKPENTVWNDNGANGMFTQNWSSSNGWTPASYSAAYSKTAATCAFVCTGGYIWHNGACETAPSQNASCTGLPLNASWNTVSSITQSYDGENWLPSNVGVYSTVASTTECHFKCNEHYTWNGTLCAAATNTFECEDLPENAQWNTVESYSQMWNGEDWEPADSEAQYNEEPSTTECRFICKENYTWINGVCTANTQTANCNAKPANTVWNDEGADGIFIQTWSGEAWLPATHASTFSKTPGECVFKCTTGYVWDGTRCATAPTQSASCTGLPANAKWNTVSGITQTWDGDNWLPTDVGVYDTNSSTTECRFVCKTNYTWKNNECTPDAKIDDCIDLPANATWNTATQLTRTWNGTTWIPSNKGSYNETPSTTQCRFICNSNYTWEESTFTCVANTQESDCIGLPNDAQWNAATRISQTWSGTEWLPTASGSYNETASTTECRFTCNEDHFWDGSAECINPCDTAPCDDFSYTTGGCTPFSLNSYYCECRDGYWWWGEKGGCKTHKAALGNICTGQEKCYNNSEEMVCPAEGEDFFGQDFQYAELGTCIPQIFRVETISGDNVVVDFNTGLMWQQTIPTTARTWSYCSGLTYAGYDDWRLPTPKELLTIVDNSRYNPAIDTTYFPNTPNGYFWSSSTYVDDTYYAWSVDFNNGGVGLSLKSLTSYVRCVRGDRLPNSSFESTTTGIVTDTKTGLIWRTAVVSGKWQQALDYCENLTYAGYSDWRLPNKNELASLVNYGKNNPASDFPNMPSKDFWSSSTYVYDTNYAWGVSFSDGDPGRKIDKTEAKDVRCVRSE